jgi:hypothetical protein
MCLRNQNCKRRVRCKRTQWAIPFRCRSMIFHPRLSLNTSRRSAELNVFLARSIECSNSRPSGVHLGVIAHKSKQACTTIRSRSVVHASVPHRPDSSAQSRRLTSAIFSKSHLQARAKRKPKFLPRNIIHQSCKFRRRSEAHVSRPCTSSTP